MFKYSAVLVAVLVSIQSAFGGVLHGGESYAAIPAEYAYAASTPYAKLGAYSSPLTAAYAGRYAAHSGYATGYGAAPFTAAYAAPIAKYTTSLAAAPLAHSSYAAPLAHASYAAPLQSYASYSAPLIGHSTYAAAPITAYGSYAAPLGVHGAYDATPLASYAAPLAGHASYGSIGHAAELSAW